MLTCVYWTATGSWKRPTKSWPSTGSPWTRRWPTSRPSASCRAPLPGWSSRWPGGPSLRWPVRQFHVHPRPRAPSQPTPPRYPQTPVHVFWSKDLWKLTSTLGLADISIQKISQYIFKLDMELGQIANIDKIPICAAIVAPFKQRTRSTMLCPPPPPLLIYAQRPNPH